MRLTWSSIDGGQHSNRLQDTPYLSPIIKEIEAEIKEREDLEAMVVKKPAKRS